MKQKKWGRRLVLFFFPGVLIFLVSCTGGLPAASWFGVSAGDDVAYLAANEQLFALNLESGAELWAFPAAPNREVGPFFSTPLVTADSVVVGGFGDGKLYAVARNGGSQDWSVETDAAIVDGPVTIDGEIVVGNNDGVVYRVDWETQSKELLLQADSAIWATPLVDRAAGRLYIASMDHHLYALDLTTGEQVWVFEAGGALVGTPAISDGKLYFGDLSSTFYVIDAGTAGELWRVDTQGWVWGGPLVDGDTVYFGDLNGNLYALDARTGDQRWLFEAEGGVRVTPVLSSDNGAAEGDNLLYFGTREGRFYALKPEDGTQQWALPLTGAIYSQPILHAGYLLVSPHNATAKLVALDPVSGAERWSYPPQEE